MAQQLWKSFNGKLFNTENECISYEKKVKESAEFNKKIKQMLSKENMEDILYKNLHNLLEATLSKISSLINTANLSKAIFEIHNSKISSIVSENMYLRGNIGISQCTLPTYRGYETTKQIALYYFLNNTQERLRFDKDELRYVKFSFDDMNRKGFNKNLYGLSESYLIDQLKNFKDIEDNLNDFSTNFLNEVNKMIDLRANLKDIITNSNLIID